MADELRELDKQVAEKVIGECFHVLTADMDTSHRAFRCKKCGLRGFNYQTDHEGRVCGPAYSTDIAAAMQVAEKIWNDGGSVRMETGNHLWHVELLVGGIVYPSKHSKSLPHAICLAALATIESKSAS